MDLEHKRLELEDLANWKFDTSIYEEVKPKHSPRSRLITAARIALLEDANKRAHEVFTYELEAAQKQIKQQQTDIEELVETLYGLLSDIQEYQTINNLGGDNNHWQVRARTVIAKHRE